MRMKLKVLSCALFIVIPCVFGGDLDGAEEEIPIDNPEVVRLSQVALLKLNEGKLGSSKDLIEIVKASRQVVSGTLTKLTLRISEGDVKDTCEVEIWEQPWLNKTEVTFPNCGGEKNNAKRSATLEEEDVKQKHKLMFQLFTNFATKHNKVYETEAEFKKRFQIFRANINKIKVLRENEQGTAQYGLTWFADLSAKEFRNHLGLKTPDDDDDEFPHADIPDIELPDEFDWRHYNVVTPVKDQKSCGSCWAFSVTGNVEGQWALKKGELLSLSEQELIDCDDIDEGCNGGYMTNAYKAIMKLGGLETESDYPYEAEDEPQCLFKKSEVKAVISGAVNITSNEVDMAKWLVKNGPMSVALNANAMQFYFGGVSHPPKFLCDPNDLNHGVLIVGFGVHKSTFLKKTLPYWLIKNSWGHSWGERGYYKLFRGSDTCGISRMVSSAVVN